MSVVISTSTAFEAAHRQLGDPSKCGRLHGHNWVVEWIVEGDNLNQYGYLVDFKLFKEITDKYDHAVLLHKNDPLIDILRKADQKVIAVPYQPTCENLARIFVEEVSGIDGSNVFYTEVKVKENGKSYAVFSSEDL